MFNKDKYYLENDQIAGYAIKEMLGEGQYGIVYLAADKDNNKYVIKQLKKKISKRNSNKLFYEEMTLKRLHHTYFPKFIANYKDDYSEGYILEYIEGEVFEDIVRQEGYQFKRDEIYGICEQLLDIAEVLHSRNIVHRDIRLPNIIRKENKELSLIDFGLARIMDTEHNTQDIDYWYIGDFLIHLYYTTYKNTSRFDRPWYKELNLTTEEKEFLLRLMGIEKIYQSIPEIRQQLNLIKYRI
ncbi:MAG: protein kinase family protein [Mobilitalea sp.]